MYSDLPEIPGIVLLLTRIILGVALMLSCWRLLIGPAVEDRIVAMELVAAILMSQFIVHVLVSGFISYLDVALAIAVISFLGTVAYARYLEKRKAPL